jgi:hypothetical protein
MKRGSFKPPPTKKAATSTPLGALHFSLLPEQRVTPRDLDEFESYYAGDVLIHACPLRPSLVGTRMPMKISNLISTTPYFIYGATQVELQASTLVIDKRATPCEAKRIKPGAWGRADVAHFVAELMRAAPSWGAYIERVMQNTLTVDGTALAALAVRSPRSFQELDVVSLPYKSMLFPYLVGYGADPTRKKTFHALKTAQLIELHTLLCATPWELVWRTPMRTRFRLDPLKPEQYERMVRDMAIQMPPHISFALRIYFDMIVQRETDKHTLFLRSSYNTVLPCIARAERDALERDVYAYLFERDVVLVHAEYLALKHDVLDATQTRDALERVRQNSISNAEPKLRGVHVPQLFPPLTARQTEIATYIRQHDITIVEGLPGTGKTALITWVFSHYKKVMMTSFVGAMVRSLQKRNGRRREVAHTIHHLLCVAKYRGEEAKEWLAWFEVLVLDEFSNVSMHLFAKLMALMPNVRKIVLVGDHRQLQPIECGNPMADMLRRYGSHLLRDNLRVVPALKALQEAPRLIAEGQSARINFTPNGPLTLVPRLVDTKHMLKEMFQITVRSNPSLLSTHIVLLLNRSSDGRHAVNQAAMEAYEEMGVLKPPHNRGVYVRYGVSLYAGCKITVLKNYNTPIEKSFGKHNTCKSDPVSNGELFIILSIERCSHPATGIRMVCTDSADASDLEARRTLWIDAKWAIHPGHIDHGYATTTYKSQGREFPNVIYINRTDPQEHWTRAQAYVALSRATQRCWVAGERSEFERVCKQPELVRRTVFGIILNESTTPVERVPYEPAPMVPAAELHLLTDAKKPCVKVLCAPAAPQ